MHAVTGSHFALHVQSVLMIWVGGMGGAALHGAVRIHLHVMLTVCTYLYIYIYIYIYVGIHVLGNLSRLHAYMYTFIYMCHTTPSCI